MGLVTPLHVDLPGLGVKLMFLALAGRFFSTEPPGKPHDCFFFLFFFFNFILFLNFKLLY